MRKLLPILLLTCACAGPMTIGVPGHEREVKAVAPLKYHTSGEAAFCVASIPIAYPIGTYAGFAFKAPFRDIRLLTDGHPGPQGCDVFVRLIRSDGVFGPTVVHTVQVYSAYTRELIWEGSIKGMEAVGLLAPAAHRALQPGQPAHDKMLESKKRGGAPEIEDVESFAGSSLTPEKDWYGTDWYSAVRVGKARPQEEPVAAAPVPAPAPAASPAPAAPSRPVSDVDEAPARRASRRGHAVIVGVERYRGRLPKADFADSDARTMARYAHAVLGFPEENIALLSDETATRGDLVKHFEKWLANRVEKDDDVFVYFSGHGAPDTKSGDAYLVPYDGDPTYLEETAYPLKNLYAALAKLPAKKITVALDSCFSGAGGRSVIAKGARPLVAVRATEAPAGVTVIAAASSEQISNSYDEKGHGLFTYFFLKGLKEKGSDLKEVFDYLKPEVAKVARRQYNADQEPQWREGRR